jgi:transmembrane sensor
MRDAEAANWLMRLQGDDVPQTEVDAWLDWCQADPRNLDAFDRARSLYDGLQMAGDTARKDFLRLAEQTGDKPATKGLTARWRLAAIGTAAAMCGVAVLLWIFSPPSAPVEQAQYRAERGGQRDLRLADHSRVVLASDSVLSSQYSASRRLLKLERGEAYFEVEEDRSRPFVVDAGSVVVTATGTAFNVRRTRGRTVVSVTKGAVQVVPVAANASARLHLKEGYEAVYSDLPDGRVVVIRIDPATVMARQHGILRYENEPLGSILEDINRYVPNAIIANDEKVRELTLTGEVRVERVQRAEHAVVWVLALEQVLPVRVSLREDGSILVEGRPSVAR